MNVLFIGKRYYTNRDALEERYGRIYRLPWHWAKQGARTQLWLIDYHGRRRLKKQDDAMSIDSTPIRSIGWVAKALWVCMGRMNKRAPTHIVASGDVYIGLLGWFLARVTGARFVFDVYDKYDEFGGFRRPLRLDLFKILLERADNVFFASHSLAVSLGPGTQSAILVPNGIDLDHFRPLDRQSCRDRLKLPRGRTLVGYFGSMELDRGVVDLVTAISALRCTGMDIELLLGGRLDLSIDPNQDGVRYVGNVSFDEVPSMLAACDLLAVPYRRSPFIDAGASNKIAEALACVRPLVATNTPNLTANFPEQAAALADRLAEPGNAQDLVRVIKLQLLDPRVVAMPHGMGWNVIAAKSAKALCT